MSSGLPEKIQHQITKAGLPTTGKHPFIPKLFTNRKGEQEIRKEPVSHGPKNGKRGFVVQQGRIWIKDWAHADVPDHWDVQVNGGKDYIRVGPDGNEL